MRAILIGDGLAEANLSPDDASHPAHVGSQEVHRLMGAGADYGHGPLPTFLRLATGLEKPQHLEVKLLDPALDMSPENLATDTFSARSGLSTALREVRRGANVLPLPTHSIPWKFLEDTVDAARAAEARDGGTPEVRCLVVGTHTERRILSLALFLRALLASPRVAVAPHLVGSATRESHFATLRSTLPAAGVEVLLDLEEAAEFVGLDPAPLAPFACRRCSIEPQGLRESIGETPRQIIELLCMHWTHAELRPLQGGFSGSLLFLAEGARDGARTEPLVLKIDEFSQMRRELAGYYQVQDLFGRNVPTFGPPVQFGDLIGVGMELASMEGRPSTLQEIFEQAESEGDIRRFLRCFDKALALLTEKLYSNTQFTQWVVPYRAFGLHTEQQLRWFQGNCVALLENCQQLGFENTGRDPQEILEVLRSIVGNEDGVDSEVCLRHGDLNFANILCDQGENLWFIDWTHSGWGPLELDFAKLENDLKFVLSKELDLEDLPRLRTLETLLLAQPIPPEPKELPPELSFVRWDLRFRKILHAVRRLREVCFALEKNWLVYRVSLLRYALHTLSFDTLRGRGECEPPQLLHALHSVDCLATDLATDPFNLQIRGERPPSYPSRQRLARDEAPWTVDNPSYDPPYHVDPQVLANDASKAANGWADPEDFSTLLEDLAVLRAEHYDAEGRPLNPRGRTGIRGRGLLGCWGRNLSVTAVVVRIGTEPGQAEILLGRRMVGPRLDLPKGFVLSGESPEVAIARVLEHETGWSPGGAPHEVLQNGYVYDPRQTDHAWVEARAVLFRLPWNVSPGALQAGGDFNEIRWRPLTAASVNRVASDQARIIRKAVERLRDDDAMHRDQATHLLEQTG